MIKVITLVFLIISTTSFAESWNDVSQLNKENIHKIFKVKSEKDILNAILYAKEYKKKIVVSGSRHSQGGHIVYPDAVLIDISGFDKIISIQDKVVRVQSGITWEKIQEGLNPLGLSLKVMQSSNIFTVGGSLSANAHGRDPAYGPIIETVKSIKIALSTGGIVIASRIEHPDLFYAAIGGYGLLGIILEVELELTNNIQLLKTTKLVSYADYTRELKNNFNGLVLHFGRCSIVKSDSFLKECFSINYKTYSNISVTDRLINEENIFRNAKLLRWSSDSNIGKNIRWSLQKRFVDVPGKEEVISRNNAMRPPVKFLHYEGKGDTDILQEYYIPIENFNTFMDGLRSIMLTDDVNLLSITLRHLKENKESILSYSNSEMIAIVLYINIGTDEASLKKAKGWTQELIDQVILLKGSYYLTYQRFPTKDQFQQAYPNWSIFKQVKRKYDPDNIFINNFYEYYF